MNIFTECYLPLSESNCATKRAIFETKPSDPDLFTVSSNNNFDNSSQRITVKGVHRGRNLMLSLDDQFTARA